MDELYNAIAGSPITYLTGDISAEQTTIAVADDSALPNAPNICTIGYGENIETIRYGAKSNGVLQDVTRGIEGTPRAWQSGTEVARFYTAYDHNAIIDSITTHKAEDVSEVVGATRDLSLEGLQTITTQINKEIKSILAFGQVSDTKKFFISITDKNTSRGTYSDINGNYGHMTNAIVFREGSNRTEGSIQNIRNGAFDINWRLVGSGSTGTGSLKFLVQYHGE